MSLVYDITFHPSWWHEHVGIDFSQPFFDDPQYRIECDVKMRRALYDRFGRFGLGEKAPLPRPLLGTDLLAAGYLHSELMGCDIVYKPDNSPQVVCKNADAEAIEAMLAPDLDKSPVWARTQRQLDWLLEKYGRAETYVNLMGIQNVALDLMGQELFVAYYTDEDAVSRLLGEITKLSIDVGKRFKAVCGDISGGVTAVCRRMRPECYLTSNCSVEMVSNDIYETFLLEHDNALAAAFGSLGVHHCGQTMEHVCDGYSKLKNLTFAEVGAGSDLAYVRSRFPRLALNARYSPVALKTEAASDIETKVNALYEAGRGGEGLLSISCVGIDSGVSDDNINAFLSACSKLA